MFEIKVAETCFLSKIVNAVMISFFEFLNYFNFQSSRENIFGILELKIMTCTM
jgi:hypothetical protein